MSGYVKLFSSILTSSVWGEADSTRIVWITLLALADRNGEAMASVGGLARSANMERENCEDAIRVLSSPDPDDRSGVRDGVRIEKIQGGWRIINFATYREKMRAADRTEYLRRKQAESRARRKNVNKASTSQPVSTSINQNQPIAASSTTTPTETTTATTSPKARALSAMDRWQEEFDELWSVCKKKVGKIKARKAYFAAKKAGEMPDLPIVKAALEKLQRTEKWTEQGRQFQPYMEAWLNRGGWDDEIPETNGTAATPDRTCTRCAGKGYAEVDADMGSRFNPETQQTERIMKRTPCTRCQSTGRF